MRHLTTLLAIGLALISWSRPARATTPGPTCRSACAPRIAEQCGDRTGRELRRCRRPLVRACKATSPEVACLTTSDLTRDLGDRRLNPTSDSTLLLCQDGHFVLSEDTGAPTPGQPTSGEWHVELVDGALSITLDVNAATLRQLSTEPDGAGGFVVDGERTVAPDATLACAPPTGQVAPEPTLDPRDPERVLAVARALTDRTVSVTTQDPNGPSTHSITLCSAGGFRDVTIPITLQPERDQGTWTIDETGTSITLSSEQGVVPASVDVTVLADGRVLLNNVATSVDDARAACIDVDLETRFTALLTGNAYAFDTTSGIFHLRTTLAFCTADSFGRRFNLTLPSGGQWKVEATDGVAELSLIDGASGIELRSTLSQAADGSVLVDGEAPVPDPTSTLRALCS